MIKKEKTMIDKMLEKREDFDNPIVAEVERVKDLRIQAMGIKKDLMKVDDPEKGLMIKDIPATQIIKQEIQGILKADKKLKKEHEFLR